MIIKERKYKTCPKCKARKLVKDEEYGCDNCKAEIDLSESGAYLRADIFHRNDDCEHLHFCSWRCVFEKLKTVQTDFFISLPYLLFDEKNPKMDIRAFWAMVDKTYHVA